MTRRRRGRRRRGFRRNYRGRTLMPFKVRRVLKTVQYTSLDAGAGTINAIAFPVNSANDPFGALGSQQPLGHDQYSGLYERCAVIGGSISVEACSTDGTAPVVVGIGLHTSSTTLTNYDEYHEYPANTHRLMTADMDKVTFGLSFGVGKYFQNRKILTDDRLNAAIGADPTDKLYCHLYHQSADKTANPAVAQCIVTLKQIIVYYRPKQLTRS